MGNPGIKKRELSEDEKERIINDFLPFIKYTAFRLAWRLPAQLTTEDLISVGIMGLLDALNRYREEEAKMNTFVEYRIKGAMLDELRAHDWMPKSVKTQVDAVKKAHNKLEKQLGRLPEGEEVAASLGIKLEEYYKILHSASAAVTCRFEDFRDKGHEDGSLDILESIPDPNARSPLAIFEDSKNKEALARLITKLSEKERLVLSLYYWEELTMKEIGKALGITEGRVCQLHNQALVRLKAKIEL